jgi:diguanylate cyclase (GGDEF)-like protein
MSNGNESPRQKILIVDDTPANIEILYSILKGGYDVLFAKNGGDAIRIALQQLPDLILLDIMMPGMDGYQVCRVLKADPLSAKIPIIFVTAMSKEEDEAKGLQLGAIDYLTKPITPPIVLARVRNHLQLKRNADLLEQLTAQLEEKNRALEVLARVDGLTGVANRRHFDEMLKQEVQRAKRNGRYLSLIFCDIDFFKRYNDHYGHVAGDKCLQALGELLKGSFKRAGEVPARYGGEEFAVVLPDTTPEIAEGLGERLRRMLQEQALPHEESELGVVTISVGVSGGLVARGQEPEWFIKEADRALYHAKAGGRNRVALSADCPPEPGDPHQGHGDAGHPEHDPVQLPGYGA